MRTRDLVALSFSSMAKQKVRTLLTLAGVIVGTLTLALSLAVGRGVDHAVVGLFHRDAQLRKIHVNPNYETREDEVPADQREPRGTMSEEKRKRLRAALVRTWVPPRTRKPQVVLTASEVARLRALEHVERVEPGVRLNGKANFDGKALPVSAISISPTSHFLEKRLLAGRLFNEADRRAAIVHEYLLYRWGLASDRDADSAIGKTFTLEYRSEPFDAKVNLAGMLARPWMLNLEDRQIPVLESVFKKLAAIAPFLPISREERNLLIRVLGQDQGEKGDKPPPKPALVVENTFTIVGVIREHRDGDDSPGFGRAWELQNADILLPTEGAVEFYLRAPLNAEAGFEDASVTVDQEDEVKAVFERIKSTGYRPFSLLEHLATVRMNVMLVSMATAFVAIIALLVAALGITNTMVMSVLERTREIGIMMALGARPGNIRLIFLVEGIVLGLLGGLIGLGLAWLASFPGDRIAHSYMDPQTPTPVKDPLFLFPLWLLIGAPAVATLITTLGALYPSIRASRLDPVASLRHE
ncbi:MAG: hypothetical protein ABS79_01425 [Planctomycetes bacterium SCN 63-9]|nr:MAG: hypothetical protein ABS79_01425 [Planctomycetes bacterium SCN 63-9]